MGEETQLGIDGGSIRPGPMAGLKVVEVAAFHAGPGSGAIFSDLGADVIKVEAPRGDPMRAQLQYVADTTVTFPWMFELANRGKRSICLDVATEKGLEIVNDLVRQADVFITNLRGSTTKELKIDYANLSAINPRLIHLSVSGYGQAGPMAQIGGFDGLGQAMGGMMYMPKTDEPRPLDTILVDQLTTIVASHAALAALYQRERTGKGDEVHVSLYSSTLWMNMGGLHAAGTIGKSPRYYDPPRTENPAMATTYRCGDGKWMYSSTFPMEKYWPGMCRAIGRPDLENDERFATNELRATNNAELIAILEDAFGAKTRAECLEMLHAEGCLFAPIQKPIEVLTDPQAIANGYVVPFQHRTLGAVTMPGYPAKFGASEAGIRGPAPDLGEHTDEILAEYGYDPAAIAEAGGPAAARPGYLAMS